MRASATSDEAAAAAKIDHRIVTDHRVSRTHAHAEAAWATARGREAAIAAQPSEPAKATQAAACASRAAQAGERAPQRGGRAAQAAAAEAAWPQTGRGWA